VIGEPLLDGVFDVPATAWLQWPVYGLAIAGVLGLGRWAARRASSATLQS